MAFAQDQAHGIAQCLAALAEGSPHETFEHREIRFAHRLLATARFLGSSNDLGCG